MSFREPQYHRWGCFKVLLQLGDNGRAVLSTFIWLDMQSVWSYCMLSSSGYLEALLCCRTRQRKPLSEVFRGLTDGWSSGSHLYFHSHFWRPSGASWCESRGCGDTLQVHVWVPVWTNHGRYPLQPLVCLLDGGMMGQPTCPVHCCFQMSLIPGCHVGRDKAGTNGRLTHCWHMASCSIYIATHTDMLSHIHTLTGKTHTHHYINTFFVIGFVLSW